jgi:predicted RNase H-like HicB family nuclease
VGDTHLVSGVDKMRANKKNAADGGGRSFLSLLDPRPTTADFRVRRQYVSGFDPRFCADYNHRMKSFTAIVERCSDTGLYVGYVPGFAGAHSQGASLDELKLNLEEVISLLLEDGEPALETQFIGTQTIQVG